MQSIWSLQAMNRAKVCRKVRNLQIGRKPVQIRIRGKQTVTISHPLLVRISTWPNQYFHHGNG